MHKLEWKALSEYVPFVKEDVQKFGHWLTQKGQGRFCLIHGDLAPANLVWCSTSWILVGFLDWEWSRFAPSWAEDTSAFTKVEIALSSEGERGKRLLSLIEALCPRQLNHGVHGKEASEAFTSACQMLASLYAI